jgi:hypothetical protein
MDTIRSGQRQRQVDRVVRESELAGFGARTETEKEEKSAAAPRCYDVEGKRKTAYGLKDVRLVRGHRNARAWIFARPISPRQKTSYDGV